MPSLLLTCAIALSLGGCDRQSPGEAQQQENSAAPKAGSQQSVLTGEVDRSEAGVAMPEMQFVAPDGSELDLADLKGKPVLINLWATWCAPCVVEMPMLDELAEMYDGKLRVVTISQDLQGAEKVDEFFASREFTHLEPWLDPENNLGFHYGSGVTLPTTILYDADGMEVWRIVGGYEWTGEEALALVEEAL